MLGSKRGGLVPITKCPWCGACSTDFKENVYKALVCRECGTHYGSVGNSFGVPEENMAMKDKNTDKLS